MKINISLSASSLTDLNILQATANYLMRAIHLRTSIDQESMQGECN